MAQKKKKKSIKKKKTNTNKTTKNTVKKKTTSTKKVSKNNTTNNTNITKNKPSKSTNKIPIIKVDKPTKSIKKEPTNTTNKIPVIKVNKPIKKETLEDTKKISRVSTDKKDSLENTKKISKTNINKTNNISKKEIPSNNEKTIEKNKPHKKKYRLKKKYKRKLIKLIIFTIILSIFIYYIGYYISPTPIVKKVYIDEDNNMVIDFLINKKRKRNKIYCIYKTDESKVSINDKNWTLTKNNKCIYPIEGNNRYYTYLKNEDNNIFSVNSSKIGRVYNLKINNDVLYLPINGTHKIDITYDSVGYLDKTIKYEIDNKEVLKIENDIITGLKDGTALIKATIMDQTIDINVTITSLITNRKKDGFDYSKPNLTCKKYTKEQNDLLDTILKEKIKNVGYKTRAGVVEAARFLTLDFPYRITYFYENGRQTTNNVDGEGRYYHEGLYLNTSKFQSITGSKKGPQIWGCPLYSVPDKKTDINGLDCSGFVSWALLNGGFNVKDVGAGWSNNLDLTDYGTVKKVTSSLTSSNRIKVGDLLHSTRLGGHIGIIVGIDSNNYYVAQAIWYNPVGVVITKIQKSKLANDFPHVVLMDKYYKKDGLLTNMW